MAPKKPSIISIAADEYIKPTDDKRTKEGQLDTYALRKEIGAKNREMSDLGAALKTSHSYFDTKEHGTSLDMSLANMQIVLPEQLATSFSKLTATEKAAARDTYKELSEQVYENHTESYIRLQKEITKENLFEIGEDWEKRKLLTKTFEYIQDGKKLPENVRLALSKYNEHSWAIVLTHHRFITPLSIKLSDQLKGNGFNFSEEDVFQQSLLEAFKMASFHDGKKSTFTTYFGKYHKDAVLRSLLQNEGIGYGDLKLRIRAQNKASKILRNTIAKNDSSALLYMTELYYFRADKSIDFEDEHIFQAMWEFEKVTEGGGQYKPNPNILQTKSPIDRLHKRILRFSKRQHALNNFRNQESLDREKTIRYIDKSGNQASFKASKHERVSSINPNERETETQMQKDALAYEMRKAVDSGLNSKEIDVINMRYGLTGEDIMTLDELGKKHGITRERIRQIEARAIRKLRHPIISQRLREHL